MLIKIEVGNVVDGIYFVWFALVFVCSGMGEWRSFDWVMVELVYSASNSNGNHEREGLAILVGLHERGVHLVPLFWWCGQPYYVCFFGDCLSVGWCTWQVSAAMCCYGRPGIEGLWVICCVLIWFSSWSLPCIGHSGILIVEIVVHLWVLGRSRNYSTMDDEY